MRHALRFVPFRRLVPLAIVAACVSVTACIWIFQRTEGEAMARPTGGEPVTVSTPVKAHLMDGSVVVFPNGASIDRGILRGAGKRSDLALRDQGPVASVPLDSVLGMESFRTSMNAGDVTATILVSSVTSAPLLLGVAIAIACASNPKCFGSCPTFYADSAGHPVLQAEGFSYSIAPLFEARDVDRLRASADTAGVVRLEVRNEALETHYINHLELLEVRHGADELVVPDERQQPLAVRDLIAPNGARDRRGRDLRSLLADADGNAFRTDSSVIDSADASDADDHVDLTLATPPGTDSVAIVFRMRNSLLNTVLLYDLMLGAPGLRALDWQARDLEEVGPATALGRWYAQYFGMRIAVRDGPTYRQITRIADTGPVAWKDVAVVVPVPTGDTLHIRLSFLADDWRIDQVRVARKFRHPAPRSVPLARLIGRDSRPDTSALASLQAADQRYLVTSPGDRFLAEFDAAAVPADSSRTFLLASQGYYIEWVRGSWIKQAGTPTPFTPSSATLLLALHRWRAEQPDLERRFAATRVPVR